MRRPDDDRPLVHGGDYRKLLITNGTLVPRGDRPTPRVDLGGPVLGFNGSARERAALERAAVEAERLRGAQ